MENENELMTNIGGKDDAIIPDGWDLSDENFSLDAMFGAEQSGQTDGFGSGNSDNTDVAEPDAGASTESTESEDSGRSVEEDAQTGQSGQTDTVMTNAPRTFKLKINRESREVSLTDDEITAYLQKGFAFDEMKGKAKYREVYQEQIDQGMTPEIARIVAKDAAGKQYSVTDDEETVADNKSTDPDSADTYTDPPAPDFTSSINQLRVLYPDFNGVPDEVSKSVAQGADLINAYIAYRGKQSSATVANLKRENAILKQNAASAAKAPVKGVTGGGTQFTGLDADFVKGFDSGAKW